MGKAINKISRPLYGLALVGGFSQRMRKDKSQLRYHGKPQYIHMLGCLAQVCEKVFVSARAQQRLPGSQRINDLPEFKGLGPLSGILSAQQTYPKAAWLVLACDLPLVDYQTLKHLCRYRNLNKIATAYLSRYDNLPEPLCAIYEPLSKKQILTFLRKGIRCPRKMLIHSPICRLKLKQAHALDNVNTPQDYKKVKARLKK